MLTEKQQKAAAAAFAQRWQGRGYEKGESQSFWLDLLANVFGVQQPTEYIRFEQQVMLDRTSFIDAVIPATHVMIEQKSLGKGLRQAIRQSDGTPLKPIEQAQRYSAHMPYSERPRWIVISNFAEFDVYDLEHPHDEPQHILLADLEHDFHRLSFLTHRGNEHIRREEQVSLEAGAIVARIYDALLPAYSPQPTAEDLRQLNILCVRIVFCLYAEDAGIIHRKPRYCLWLGDCSPAEIKAMPLCYERVANVRQLRAQSKSAGTRKIADTPTRFHVENMPDGDSILVPRVSSERRRYVPMGFIPKGTFASDAVQIIPSATLYHFGILESNVHMAWMRAVCGRLKSDYRYSKDVVYNNFPWPAPTPGQAERIEATARAILDARAMYADSSLADLYDPVLMPPELLKAHRQNDLAVMHAYGFGAGTTEAECVARLLDTYARMAK